MLKSHSYTQKYSFITRVIVTECFVAVPNSNVSEKFNAIWDTGATGTTITKKVSDRLNLTPCAIGNSIGVHGEQEVNIYEVELVLPNFITFPNLAVSECDSLVDPCDILIGMDVISCGDFAITNNNGKTIFSFRIPSRVEIDFKNADQKHDRNKSCYCGSGLKFKNCCL